MRRLRLVLLTVVLTVAALVVTAGAVAANGAGFRAFVVPLQPQAPNDDGSGVAVIRVNPTTDMVCYAITVEGVGEPTEPAAGLGAAHIHDDATHGIFVDLETEWMQTGQDRFTTRGCTTASSGGIDALLADPDAYYVNIHTAAATGGALTGSLG